MDIVQEYGGDTGGSEEGVQGEGVEEKEGTVVALNLDHMQGVFLVAAIGWFSAILFYGIELSLFKKSKNGR